MADYLKRYSYQLSDSEKAINIVLPSDISGYGYLTFIIAMGNSIYFVNVSGGDVESQLSSNGIESYRAIGSEVDIRAIKESGKIRIKCISAYNSLPVTVICLRQGISVENLWPAAS